MARRQDVVEDTAQRLGALVARARVATRLALLLSLILIGVNAGLIYFALHPPHPRFFATSPRSPEPEPLIALDEPMILEEGLVLRARGWIEQAFTFNFLDVRQVIGRFRNAAFLPEARGPFTDYVVNSGFLDRVESQQLQVSSIVVDDPVITNQGMVGNRYSWNMEARVLVQFDGGGEPTREEYVVRMTVQLVSPDELPGFPQAVGISRFRFSER